ncbi:hypothetical protein ACQB60_24160 [Actinomycetota bacterium Odt1-20B]
MTDTAEVFSGPLAAPVIDAADSVTVPAHGGVPRLVVPLEQGGARRLVVRVEPYEGMSGGDQVQLRWDTGVLRTSRIDGHVVGAEDVGHSIVFTVSGPKPGTARVSYLVHRATGEWRASERLEVTVRG